MLRVCGAIRTGVCCHSQSIRASPLLLRVELSFRNVGNRPIHFYFHAQHCVHLLGLGSRRLAKVKIVSVHLVAVLVAVAAVAQGRCSPVGYCLNFLRIRLQYLRQSSCESVWYIRRN